jgi:hypothetical protein
MMDRGSRNNAGKQETTKSALGSFLLAMATFLPSPGCTTSNSVGKQDDRPGSTAQDTSPHAQPKSPNANFIHNPEPRELLEACQKSLPNSVLRLNPEGNGVQIQLSTTASGGQTINGFRDLFWPGQKVVISTKNGMPYIQEKVEAANGDQLERYTWAGVERPQTIAELGDVSFKQLAKVADSD